MSYRRSLSLSWLVLAIGVLLLVNLQAAAAQPDVPQPVPFDEVQPGQPVVPVEPEKMAFQPPDDAAALVDFVPPQAHVVQGDVVAQEVSAFSQEDMVEANAAFQTKDIPLLHQSDTAVRLADDRLGVIVERDTFAEPVSLEMRSLAALSATAIISSDGGLALDSINGNPFMRFELEILDEQKQPVPTFDKQVRLIVDLHEYGIDLEQEGGAFYLAYEDESNPGEWHEIDVNYYGSQGLISADVAHFSNWEAGWRPEAWALEWKPPTVNEFTGAAAYQYSFNVPPGRNGLQPNVSLHYSSASLRGAI